MTTGDESDKTKFVPSANAVDITPDKDGGVLKEIIKEGTGDATPGPGASVTVSYHGTLTDGTVFDSCKDTGRTFTMTVGKDSVIRAWEIAVPTMKKGEVAMITCKPEYAYGEAGSPPKIPPNSTLIFEITVIDWKAEDISKDQDGSILRTTIKAGTSYPTPEFGSLVEIHLTGKYNGKVFEDRDLSFNLGEGIEFGVIEGVEQALMKFTKKEKSILEIKPKYAFKSEGNKEFGIPPNATVTYIVELKNFELDKRTWDMDAAGKLAQAKLSKEKATNYFKSGKYPIAVKLYNNSIKWIDSEGGFPKELEEERLSVLLALRLNLGLAYLKCNQYFDAKKECDDALKIDPNNVKGLFRRGQALLNINEPEEAKLNFETVLKIEPGNKLAANYIAMCHNKIKQQREKEKKIYANMFEKLAQKEKEGYGSRFGWWDNEKKKLIVEEIVEDDVEDAINIRNEKKKQLDKLKRIAQAKKGDSEKGNLKESQENVEKESRIEEKEECHKKEETDSVKSLGEWGKDGSDDEATEAEKLEQENLKNVEMIN